MDLAGYVEGERILPFFGVVIITKLGGEQKRIRIPLGDVNSNKTKQGGSYSSYSAEVMLM